MRSQLTSLRGVLEALDLDTACLALLEQTDTPDRLKRSSTPEAIYATIRTIGQTLNVHQKANQLADDLEERINIVIHKLKFVAKESRPTVLFLHDVSPVQVVLDDYLTHLVDIAGGIPCTDTATGSSAPDIVIIISDKPVSQLLNELPDALSKAEWKQAEAINNDNVYIVHHVEYFRQPGALVADEVEILAEIIQPKHFIFGRDQDIWMRFSLR